MNKLLQNMLTILQTLQQTLAQEEQELSARTVNTTSLHRVTENKSEQLATLRHYDNERMQLEQQLNIKAPYEGQEELNAQWSMIQMLTQLLSQHNHRNNLLLSQHMKYTDEILSLLKSKTNSTLYGPDGYTASQSTSHPHDK